MLVPLSYNLRSLFVRRSSTLLTVLGIGSTVAVVAGILALQQGFASLYAEHGREDVAVFLRPGAANEGESLFSRDRGLQLIKTIPEIEQDAAGQPLAGMECYLAVRRFKVDGGETNVPIRGVQQASFDIRGDELRMVEGERFQPGADQVIIGSKIRGRIRGATLGDVIQVNTTPFEVVGVFESDGPAGSEIWGDLDRMLAALERYGPNSVVAKIRDDVDMETFATELEKHKEVPAKVITEREYLTSQTVMLSFILQFVAGLLGAIMGLAALFTGITTMLAALSSRTHEIGILLATGFRPFAIFLSFLFESLLLGLMGGVAGCLMVLPINGIETGTTNFQTFTEVAFAFRVTPFVLIVAVAFAVVLGMVAGAVPALMAASLKPTVALRRQ